MDRIENLLDTGGRYLSPSDRQFVSTLLSELEQFQYQAPKDRALMFHPLGGFQRYLIHKVTEVFPKLTSFSIGDEKNRRTVVCFKSKKKDQQQGFQANGSAKTLPNPKPDYVNAPPRGREEDDRRSAPRSRDSSKSRKKNDPHDDPVTSKQNQRPSKQNDQGGYMPKPLRGKKQANKRNQMKRSRSLQSSPVRAEDDVYHTDDDVRRGRRSKGESGKRAPRSASLKPPSRRRERDVSPDPSEDEFRRVKRHPPLRHNVSDASINKRSQGLRMEGKVVNGDIADPYSCGDSESDFGRVDVDAVRKEQDRHRKKAPTESLKREQARTRRHSHGSSARSLSEDSEVHHRDTSRRSSRGKRRPEYSDVDSIEVESRISGIHDDESSSDENEEDDSASLSSDERPPSYEHVKHSSSLKKAERNLNRIKRVDSQRSSGKQTSDEDGLARDSSSCSSGKPASRGSSHKSPHASTSSRHSKEGKPERSLTMPRSSKEPHKKHRSSSQGRSQTLKGPPTSSSRPKSVKKHPVPAPPQKEEEKPKRSSSSSKSRKKTSDNGGLKEQSTVLTSTDDLLDASNSTLYHPLPKQEQPTTSKKKSSKEKAKKHSQDPTRSAPPSDPSSSLTSPVTCDGTAQTDVSGTLSRKKEPRSRESTNTTPQESPSHLPLSENPDYSGPNRIPVAPQPTGNSYQQQNLLNAFHHLMQQQVQQNSNLPPLPPQLAHQLYLSWLGAYYAGATGAPPPAPPSFIIPQTNNSNSQHLDPLVNNPSNHLHDPPSNREDVARFYEQFGQPDNPRDGYDEYEDMPLHSDPYQCADEAYHPQERGRPSSKSCKGNGHCNTSIVLTDADMTDSSSATSSVAKGEVAVATNPKGGVMIYVRSQPNSRSNSTAGTHESIESLNTSDNIQSLGSSEHGSQTNLSERKKSPRGHSRSMNRPHPQSSPAKNGSSSRKALEGEKTQTPHINHGFQTNERPTNHNNNHSLAPSTKKTNSLHAADAFLEPIPSPNTFSTALSAPSRRVKDTSTPSSRKSPKNSSRKSRKDPEPSGTSFNASVMLQDANPDASHEEMILSLRRAPLATIEDDADGLLSGSHASSCSSLNSAPQVHKEALKAPPPPTNDHPPPTPIEAPSDAIPVDSIVATAPQTGEVAAPVTETENTAVLNAESDRESVQSDAHSIDRSAGNISIYSLNESDASDGESDQKKPDRSRKSSESEDEHRKSSESEDQESSESEDENRKTSESEAEDRESSESEAGTWPAPPSALNGDGADKLKSSLSGDEIPAMPLESVAVTQTINLATSAPDSLDKQTAEHLQPDRPGSSGTPEPFAAPKHLEVPLIDDPDSDASSTATDGENGEVKDARQTTSASDSSTTDENSKPSEHEENPTSTAESMAPGKPPVTTNGSNQVIEVDGEMVVIQEPEFDYYKFQPNKDTWSAPQFKKFVEIYNFPSTMSDIDVTQQLSHYRGLRLARVDPTHALCTLPTDNMAAELASQKFPAFETRPLSDASKQTKAKAKAKLENEKFEEIRSQRPKTNNSVAKRMIAGSLGQSSRSSAKRTSKK